MKENPPCWWFKNPGKTGWYAKYLPFIYDGFLLHPGQVVWPWDFYHQSTTATCNTWVEWVVRLKKSETSIFSIPEFMTCFSLETFFFKQEKNPRRSPTNWDAFIHFRTKNVGHVEAEVFPRPKVRWVRTSHGSNPPPSAVLDLLLPAPRKGATFQGKLLVAGRNVGKPSN